MDNLVQREFVSLCFVMIRAEDLAAKGAELFLRKLKDHLLFLASVSSSVHRKRQNNEFISFSPL